MIPTIEGNDKSISPRVTTKVADMAIIPKNGIDCMKALYIGNLVKTCGAPKK